MELVRWTPRDLEANFIDRVGREMGWMSRLFDSFLSPRFEGLGVRGPVELYPSVDLREEDGEYVLTADVPGLKPEEVEVDVTEDVVTLKGHHEEQREEKEGHFVRCERGSRSFERLLRLPGEIRVEDAKASVKDGILTLHLPKSKETTSRRVEVTAQ